MSKAPEAFRTISEVAAELDLPQHVLRFWETRFAQIKPMKRAGGRRYYRREDIDLLRGVRELLYDRGYTIKGVQKLLKERGVRYVGALGRGEVEDAAPPAPPVPDDAEAMADVMLGAPKRPTGGSVGGSAGNGTAGVNAGRGNAAIPEDDRALLNEVLLDLLECKRVLDQAR